MIWELPVVALRNMVIMPGVTMNIDVGRPKSKRAVDEAQSADRRVLVVTQKEAATDDPMPGELFEIGTLAVIKQVVRLPDNTYQVGWSSRRSASRCSIRCRAATCGCVSRRSNPAGNPDELRVLMQETKSSFEEYQRQNKTLRLDNYQLEGIKTLTNAGALADQIAHHATWTPGGKAGGAGRQR